MAGSGRRDVRRIYEGVRRAARGASTARREREHNAPLMDTWQTDRIRLRAFRADDWTHCARWNEEPDWSYADTFAYPPQAPDRVRAWAEAEAAKARSEDMRLIIEDRKSGQPVGTIDTNH